jgi:hypothetical protein
VLPCVDNNNGVLRDGVGQAGDAVVALLVGVERLRSPGEPSLALG